MASLSVLNILRSIKDRGTVSRTDLQQSTNLSWGTITNTTRDLLNRGLIREEGSTSTKAGRKPVRLAINPSAHGIIGLHLAAGILRCQLLNLVGETLGYEEISFDPAAAPDSVLELATQMIQRAIALPIMARRTCLGIGIAVPGVLDNLRETLRFSPPLPGWKDVPLRQFLQERNAMPVRIERAANSLALAERWFGQATQADDVLCLNLGEIVELGMLIGGEAFRGSQQMAGEFGHTTLDPEGPPCACGDKGCLDAYASLAAVRKYARECREMQSPALASVFANRSPTLEELVAAANHGDAAARAAFTRAGQMLGIGAANLIDLFNPQMIILSGVMTQAREWILPPLQAEIKQHASTHSHCTLTVSQLGERARATGACGIVLQSIFEPSFLAATELQPV